MFGAGGGTSSYREVEDTDVVLLWGSNARNAHPIFFHHLLKGIHNGARLYVVDPRRTASAEWADRWLGLDVGSDIALAHAMAREIIHAGLAHKEFVENATSGFEEYAAHVEPFTLEEGERRTGVPAEVIRETAHAYARADKAMICWTLGITEHHHGVDNVLALINLSLLCGHVGRYGSGVNPLRGQNNVQGGGDMGAIPNKLAGFQDIERDADARERFGAAWGTTIHPHYGWHLTQMFHAMERGELRTLYVIGENPARSEADINHTRQLLGALDLLVVQDIVWTKTCDYADVVLPGTASWCESEGTVTNSERRVQRVRRALDPPGEARDDMWIITEIARRLGHDWGAPTAEQVWDEVRSLSPMHRGMRYDRLEALGGIQWPCPDEEHPGSPILHERLWTDADRGPGGTVQPGAGNRPVRGARCRVPDPAHDRPAPRVVQHGGPVGPLPLAAPQGRVPRRLTRGRRATRARTGRDRSHLLSTRCGGGSGPHRSRPPRRPDVHDVPLPRAGGRQPAHDRCDRPEVGHGRVQGDRNSGREASPRRSRREGRRRRAGVRGGQLMDITLIPSAEPTPGERAALDAVLGPPLNAWEGGARLSGAASNTAAGGHDARGRRHLLLPALWALQEHIGWISPGGLNDICRRLTVPPADAYGVASFYGLLALEPRPPRVIHVCEDLACRCVGSEELIQHLEQHLGPEGELTDDGQATWYRSPCLGQCDRAPAAMVTISGDEPIELVQAPTTAAALLPVIAGAEPEPLADDAAAAGRRRGAAPAPARRSSGHARGVRGGRRLTSPCAARSSSAPRPWSPRSRSRSSSVAAARPSRPVSSGRQSPSSQRNPTTSCATQTSRSREHSKTGCSSSATRSR